MAFIWDETTNSWIEKTEEELQGLRDDVEQPIAIGNDPQQDFQRQAAQEQQSALITPNEAAEQSKAKPMFGDLGQSVADIGMIAGNTAVGLGTDVLDLVSYVGDLGRAGVDLMDGGGFNEDDYLFNDADNPWTAWRINTFEQNYNTEAAQMVSNVVRLGSSLLLGGGALKLGGKALGGVARISKLSKLGKPAAAAMGKFGLDEVFKFANKADDGGEGARLMKALNGADDVSDGAKKALKSVQQDDWLRRPFADITRDARKVGAAGVADDLERYASAVKDSVSTVFGLKYKNKLKTFGQMAAWDALATFNVMGEGNADLDETMADWVNSNFGDMQGVPIAGWLMSNTTTLVEDDAIVRKFKLKSHREWRAWSKSGKRPTNIPSLPSKTYRDDGWISWPDWLGYTSKKREKGGYLPFEEARAIVRMLKLKRWREWKEWRKSGKRHFDFLVIFA